MDKLNKDDWRLIHAKINVSEHLNETRMMMAADVDEAKVTEHFTDMKGDEAMKGSQVFPPPQVFYTRVSINSASRFRDPGRRSARESLQHDGSS